MKVEFDADDLLAIRDRIADKDHWVQGVDRTTALDGTWKYCATGHIANYLGLYENQVADIYDKFDTIRNFINVFSLQKHCMSIAAVNDTLGRNAVLSIFEEAIRAKKDEK